MFLRSPSSSWRIEDANVTETIAGIKIDDADAKCLPDGGACPQGALRRLEPRLRDFSMMLTILWKGGR